MSERIQNVHPKEYNGITYRSTLEAETAKVLSALNIPFEYEPRKIILQESFRSPFQKDKVRALTYTPDFIIGPIMLECKGFETPEWKIKKKLVLKWLQDNESKTLFYQVHDAKKSLLEVLDNHWSSLGYAIQVVLPKPLPDHLDRNGEPANTLYFDSVQQAMEHLKLQGKPIGKILSVLTGEKEKAYKYKWKLFKIKL